MRWRPIMSTIATSRKTTPTDNRQEEIAYDVSQQTQLLSTAVDWAAPSNTDIKIDVNDYITPNLYDWREPNEKSLDEDIWVNTVTLHDYANLHSHFPESTSHGQCAPTEERLTANKIRLQRSTTQCKHTRRRSYPTAQLTYDENEDIVIGYSMSTYDFVEYPPQWLRMLYRARCFPSNWHHRTRFRLSDYHSCKFNLQCYELRCSTGHLAVIRRYN